jgi:hypothetical protein
MITAVNTEQCTGCHQWVTTTDQNGTCEGCRNLNTQLRATLTQHADTLDAQALAIRNAVADLKAMKTDGPFAVLYLAGLAEKLQDRATTMRETAR